MTTNGKPTHKPKLIVNRPTAGVRAINRAIMAARIKAARPELARYLDSAGNEMSYEEWKMGRVIE